MPVDKPGPDADYWCKDCTTYVTGQEMHLHKGKCTLVPVDGKKATMKTPPSEITDQLLAEHHFITMRDTDEIYMWNDSVWVEYGETWIKQILQMNVHNVDTSFVNQVVEQVRRRTYKSREDFTPPANHINLENGIINVRTMQFMPHDRYYYFRNKMPVKYDPRSTCPKILTFLTQCLGPKEIITIIEEMASTLVSDKIEKAYMWVGSGSNGKSTAMKVLQALLGPSSYSVVPIHDLLRDRFARSELEGKMANIFPDISANEIRWTNVFKGLVSGDEVRADRKNKGSIKLRNRARMFFACNELPQLDENTDAIFRRWIKTEWTVQFLGGKRNIKLEHELTTPSELSGLLNLLLANASKLQRRGDFSYPPTVEQMRKEWHERADHIERFSKQCIIVKADASIPNDRLCHLYRKFCEANNTVAESDRTFLNRLRKYVMVDTISTRKNGRAVRIQRGIMENMEWSKSKNIPVMLAGGGMMDQFTEQPQQPAAQDVVQHDAAQAGDVPAQPQAMQPEVTVEQRQEIQQEAQQEPQDEGTHVHKFYNSDEIIAGRKHIRKWCSDNNCSLSYSKHLEQHADDTQMEKPEECGRDTYSRERDDSSWGCICYSCNDGPFALNEISQVKRHVEHGGVRYLTFEQYMAERRSHKRKDDT